MKKIISGFFIYLFIISSIVNFNLSLAMANEIEIESNKDYTYSITKDWGKGYCAKVVLKNISSEPWTWTIALDFEGSISSFWGAEYTEIMSSRMIATGLEGQDTLDVGESTEFGFCANRLQ